MGTVRDSETRAPLAGVSMETGDAPSPRTTTTGGDGAFRFEHLAPGNYRIKYTLPGYLGSDAKGTQFVSVKAGAEAVRVTLELTAFARIEGTVLDEDGEPLAGVMIHTGGSLRATTDENGRYAITQLEPGNHRMTFRTPDELRRRTLKRDPGSGETFGYASVEFYPGTADPLAAAPVAVSGGLELRGFDVRLRRVRLVEIGGHMVESTGEPLAGARVELLPVIGERAVADDGSFRIDLIQPGAYSLLVYRGAGNDALPYAAPVQVPSTGIQDLKVVVPRFPTLTGTVVAPEGVQWTGQLRLNLRSAVFGAGSRDLTVTSGTFAVEDVPPGRWVLQMRSEAVQRPDEQHPKYEVLFIKTARFGALNAIGEAIPVTESGNPPLEIGLSTEYGRIYGTVVDEGGAPAKGVVLMITRSTAMNILSMQPAVRTRDDGTFLVDGLGPGEYRLIVANDGRAPGIRNSSVVVEVKAGETATVRIASTKQ